MQINKGQSNWRQIDWGNSELWRARTRQALEKRSVRIAGLVVGIIILIVVIVPLFVSANTFRPTVEQKMSAALGRRVTLGDLSLSLFSGSLVARDVAIADDPSFSSAPFFQAKSLHIGVSTGALIFERQLHISSFTANAPVIRLVSKPDGTWNYASLGTNSGSGPQPSPASSAGSSGTGSQASAPSNISIGELKIKNGSVEVSSVPATGNPFVYDHVNVTVKNLSFATPMPFELTADLPAGGSVSLTGEAGPVGQPNAMNTPLHATIHLAHFDPVAAGVVAPADGISTVADLDAKIDSDGKTMTTTGKLTAANLKLSPNGSPAPQPVSADLSMTGNVAARTGQITDLAIHTGASNAGSMDAHINGTYQLTGNDVTLNLHLSAPNLPVDGLEQLLPAVGVRLPSGSSLHGGTLTANLAITGTPATLRLEGPIDIENTRLTGFPLAQKIEGLTGPLAAAKSASSSAGNATDIRKLTANVVSTPQSTQLSQIDCEVPSLGSATGNGTVAASGALDFQLTAKLTASGGVGGAVTTAMGNLGGMAGNLMHSTASNGVPLSVTGTTSNPSIRVNMGSMLKERASTSSKGSSTKSGILGGAQGLFHK